LRIPYGPLRRPFFVQRELPPRYDLNHPHGRRSGPIAHRELPLWGRKRLLFIFRRRSHKCHFRTSATCSHRLEELPIAKRYAQSDESFRGRSLWESSRRSPGCPCCEAQSHDGVRAARVTKGAGEYAPPEPKSGPLFPRITTARTGQRISAAG